MASASGWIVGCCVAATLGACSSAHGSGFGSAGDGGQTATGATGGTGGTGSSGGFPTVTNPMITLPDAGASTGLPPTTTGFMRDDTGTSGLPSASIAALKAGGASCTTALLYPYNNTTFPAGLISPLVQWSGGGQASYVKVTYDNIPNVQYEYAAANTGAGTLRMPQSAWDELGRRTQGTAMHVTLSVEQGTTVSTCHLVWKIARGQMKGTVYYNTYAAPNAINPQQGAVMRVIVGQPTSSIYLQYTGTETVMPNYGPCTTCHAVSADGNTMTAATHRYSTTTTKEFRTNVYTVTPAAQPATGLALPNAGGSGLYPDGSRVLAAGNPQCTGGSDSFPRAPNNIGQLDGPEVARVIDTKTGTVLSTTGLNANWYLWMPQFSPDGKHVVFNHAKPDGMGGTDRRELAVMDYDYKSNTFSNLKVVASHLGPEPSMPYTPATGGGGPTGPGPGGCMIPSGQSPVGAIMNGTCTGPCYPVDPFFTPDGKGVVFMQINQPDFVSAFPGRDTPSYGELWYADIASGKTVLLKTANSSLVSTDAQSNYFPTVLPVQVGGYFWAFWTARRSWGNQLDVNGPAMAEPGGGTQTPSQMQAYKKRIWVTAINPASVAADIQAGRALSDPSSPGFYFEGQSQSGNVRAFAALSPCVGAGATCTSGLDCCTGFCLVPNGASQGTCSDQKPMCAKTNEKCTLSSDCCPPAMGEPANTCLGGYCGFIVPQ